MRLATLQAVAQIKGGKGGKNRNNYNQNRKSPARGAGHPVRVPHSPKGSHSSYPCMGASSALVDTPNTAGRRCGALGARRTGAASLQEGQGQGGFKGRCGSRGRGEEAVQGGGATGACAGAAAGRGHGQERGAGGACPGSSVGPVSGRARRGGEEGEATSADHYPGSLTVPRAEAAGTRGRGVPGDGAWHWDVRAPNTVSTPPIGSARALSSGSSHPAPSPWVELGSTQVVLLCGVLYLVVPRCRVGVCDVVLRHAVLPSAAFWLVTFVVRCAVTCNGVVCCVVSRCVTPHCAVGRRVVSSCVVLWCVVLCCCMFCCVVLPHVVLCCVALCCVLSRHVAWCSVVLLRVMLLYVVSCLCVVCGVAGRGVV